MPGPQSPPIPGWDTSYPDPDELRSDVEVIVAAVTDALVTAFGDGISGLWFKGSAQKPWSSPIDYVPEVSDVDIHVRVNSPGTAALLRDPRAMLEVHAAIDAYFRRVRPVPVHVPRVQFVDAAEVEQLPGYVPVPAAAVRTLHGDSHRGPGDVDHAAQRRTDADRLVHLSSPADIAKAAMDLVELPGHHLFWGLRKINWRVSPVAPLVLSVDGFDYSSTWSANRTRLVHLLQERGFRELAASYAGYYLAAWRFRSSEWTDGDAGREAFAHGMATIHAGRDIGLGYH